jgi:hypothetical protein
MNFEELMKKMKAIDEGQSVDECGAMPIGISGPSEQPDNVTMNVSMNGSGAGGIRDLMAILKNIENNEHDHGHSDILVGEPSEEEPIMGAIVQSMGHEHDMGEEYENSVEGGSEPEVYGIDAVTPTGNDLASTGGNEYPKVNGGGNPMQEALVSRLAQLYDEIKEDKEQKHAAKTTMKHIKNPTKGEKVAAKDIKPGSYSDRAAMLKSAEADGRLKEAGEKKTMSRAAKGYEKYGKEGMQALAKAGKEGKNLDKVRDKYNKYDEAYNPNSVDAQHRRSLEKSRVDDLKKKAEAGDEKAKAALKRHEDKKAGMRADFDARMER